MLQPYEPLPEIVVFFIRYLPLHRRAVMYLVMKS